MKNLILILSLCFVLFSCFEKEEEIAVVPEEEGKVEECEKYKKFVEFVTSNPPRTPRSTIKKYSYNNIVVYLFEIGEYENSAEHFYSYTIDSKCNLICDASPPAVDEQGLFCLDWNEKSTFIKTIWQDER
jgi:hypothetical protein